MKDSAIRAVKKAAEISLGSFQMEQKSFRKAEDELVTEIDIKCEKAIKEILREDFPDYGFLGEEDGEETSISEYRWIIDPIDGTVNYSRGIQLYGISVALAKGNTVLLGVVYNPITDEMFIAEKNNGARLNNQKITVSKESDIDRSVIYTTELYKTEPLVRNIYKKIKQFRVTSSSAYETCLVAAGRTEAFIKVTSHAWGFAAANLIVEEAGGLVTNLDGTPWDTNSTHILSSNGLIHKELLGMLV